MPHLPAGNRRRRGLRFGGVGGPQFCVRSANVASQDGQQNHRRCYRFSRCACGSLPKLIKQAECYTSQRTPATQFQKYFRRSLRPHTRRAALVATVDAHHDDETGVSLALFPHTTTAVPQVAFGLLQSWAQLSFGEVLDGLWVTCNRFALSASKLDKAAVGAATTVGASSWGWCRASRRCSCTTLFVRLLAERVL